jgi:hypothetical protein
MMPRFAQFVGALRKQRLLLLLLTVAAAIRIWTMPYRNELRDMDEIGYVSGGLLAWEGMLPGWRAAPAAGQTWIGWLWIAARSAWDFIMLPHGTPSPLRPFAAIDQALFDTYADLGPLRQVILCVSLGIALAGVFAGYRLGLKYGGEAGAVLIGGIVALLPVYIEFTGMSRSYSDSWMLGIASISCAATLRNPRIPAVLLGLAIASRIDMVVLAPLVIWALWDNLGNKGFFAIACRTAFTSILTLIIAAPWLMVAFVGTLRSIAMVRVMGYYWNVESPRLTTLKDLTWTEGLGPLLLATLAGFLLIPVQSRFSKWTLAGLTLLIASTMFIGHCQVIQYHGGPLIAILTSAAIGTGAILNRMPKWQGLMLAAFLLILPSVQSLRLALHPHLLGYVDHSTEWIEKHVPSGTIIYFHSDFACKTVLPTAEAADAIWREVASDQAWRAKLEDGFRRFSLPAEQFPRALSEDNLCMDRAKSRRWFILGGGSGMLPRYDVRPFDICKTFGIHSSEIAETFKRTGGVLIWRTAAPAPPPPELGEPLIKWVNTHGNGTLLFVSPDIRGKLLNYKFSDVEQRARKLSEF